MKKDKNENIDELLAEVKYYINEPNVKAHTTRVAAPGHDARVQTVPRTDSVRTGPREAGARSLAPPAEPPAAYYGSPYAEPAEQPKRRRRHRFLRFLFALFIIAAVLAGAFLLLCEQPKANSGGSRKPLYSTVLICGTDESGMRTDTMMLASVDAFSGRISLMSLPRDTLVYAEWNAPKLNVAYGWYGHDEDALDNLLDYVEELIGFRPDGCAVTTLDVFVEAVDLMGGVDFDVPVDMHYIDPTQDLYIDIAAGMQHLDGEKAVQLCRFRSGYASADLMRISVQRDFISAAVKQWAKPENVVKIPDLIELAKNNITTDLSARNIMWLAAALLRCGTSDIGTDTLPGYTQTISGTSYYIADAQGIADLVNEKFNPYKKDVKAEKLVVRTG